MFGKQNLLKLNNMIMKKYIWFFFGLLLLSCSCFKKKDKENVKETTENHIQNAKALAPVIIYKTKKIIIIWCRSYYRTTIKK
jgi:hypothetical protein